MTHLLKGVSVIVCCYNSASRIEETIRHLLRQRTRDLPAWEVVLVDNNCTDRTVELALAVWQHSGGKPPLRVVREERLGLSYARRSGVFAASFPLIVFCDDDNWLGDDYVETAYGIMSSDPQIGVLGGAITPVGDEPFPPWFLSNCGYFAVGAQDRSSGDISARGYVWGAGAVMRRDLLRMIYETCGQGILVGRKGAKQGAGDDSEISKWFLLAGKSLYYSEQLTLAHYMPAARVSKEVLERMLKDGASSTAFLDVYDAILNILEPGRFRAVSSLRRFIAIVRGVRGLFRMKKGEIRSLQNLVRCCRRAKLVEEL